MLVFAKKYTVFIFFLVILFGCQSDNSPYYTIIKKSDEGHLRGVTIGTSIEKVITLEDAKFLESSMDDYLHYDYPISMGNTYTVTYDFSPENELYEIELAVFFDEIEDAEKLFEDYMQFFLRKYGKGKLADDGFTIWTIKNKAENIEIAMINDSQSYGYFSIIIRDLDY